MSITFYDAQAFIAHLDKERGFAASSMNFGKGTAPPEGVRLVPEHAAAILQNRKTGRAYDLPAFRHT
ncbi:MAG: hypothetical protein LBD55_07420 [Treponema sp.]|nr:hypothetical protein [Treponema sp.]